MSIYKKIHSIMSEIDYVPKNSTVGTGKDKYKATSETDVTNKVRKLLIKYGLIVIPKTQKITTETNVIDTQYGKKLSRYTIAECVYTFVDSDTDECLDIPCNGAGIDTQDKGVGKAVTYAYKYLFLRTFAIPTGEDPDNNHNNDLQNELENSDSIIDENKGIQDSFKNPSKEKYEQNIGAYRSELASIITNNKLDSKYYTMISDAKTNNELNAIKKEINDILGVY